MLLLRLLPMMAGTERLEITSTPNVPAPPYRGDVIHVRSYSPALSTKGLVVELSATGVLPASRIIDRLVGMGYPVPLSGMNGTAPKALHGTPTTRLYAKAYRHQRFGVQRAGNFRAGSLRTGSVACCSSSSCATASRASGLSSRSLSRAIRSSGWSSGRRPALMRCHP